MLLTESFAAHAHDAVKDSNVTDASNFADASNLERRRGLRIRQARPIKLYEPAGARYFGGQTEDISATGLRIELPASAPVRAGNIVNVHVGLNPAGQTLANRKSVLPAKIVWVDRSDRSRVTAGVEFIASIAAHLDAA
jgi:hypothetical protein